MFDWGLTPPPCTLASLYVEAFIGACQPLLPCVKHDCPMHIDSYADFCHVPATARTRGHVYPGGSTCCLVIGYPGQKKDPIIWLCMACAVRRLAFQFKSSRGRRGTMGGIFSNIKKKKKRYSILSPQENFYKFIYTIQSRLGLIWGADLSKSQNIFSTHFTQSTTETCFWSYKISKTNPPLVLLSGNRSFFPSQ